MPRVDEESTAVSCPAEVQTVPSPTDEESVPCAAAEELAPCLLDEESDEMLVLCPADEESVVACRADTAAPCPAHEECADKVPLAPCVLVDRVLQELLAPSIRAEALIDEESVELLKLQELCQQLREERDQAVECARAVVTQHEQFAEQQLQQQQLLEATVEERIRALTAELATVKNNAKIKPK